MVTVAKGFEAPIKVLFPRNIANWSSVRLAGLNIAFSMY